MTSLLLMNTRPYGGTHIGFVWASWNISNIRPLKVNVSVLSDKGICTTHIVIHGGHTGACISMTLYVLFTPLLPVNFHCVTPFTCEYGTPLPTLIFEHVSSRPAFCKLIVLWHNTLTCDYMTTQMTYTHFMVRWCYFMGKIVTYFWNLILQ